MSFNQAFKQLKKYDTFMKKDELRLLYRSVLSLQRIQKRIYHYQIPEKDNEYSIVDLGTYEGMSAQIMAFALKEAGLKGKVYTIDIQSPKSPFNSEIADVIEFWEIDAIKSAEKFEDNSIDFLFIDAGHAYRHVYRTLKAFYPKVKKLHTISGHDYSYFRGGGINVIRAVENWKRENKNKWTGFSITGEIWRFLKKND